VGGSTSGRMSRPARSALPGKSRRARTHAAGRPNATISTVARPATRSESQNGARSFMNMLFATPRGSSRVRDRRRRLEAELLQDRLAFLTQHELRERLGVGLTGR